MKRIFYIIPLLCAAILACTPEEGYTDIIELGLRETDAAVGCASGEYGIEILSDGSFSATLDDSSWLNFKDKPGRTISGSGDMVLTLAYDVNRGIERSSSVKVSRGSKTVTFTLTQKGIVPSDIRFASHSMNVGSGAETCYARLLSVYKDSELSLKLNFEGEATGWITDLYKENNFVGFRVMENSSPQARVAWIEVSRKSDPSVSDRMQVIQNGSGVTLKSLSFADLKALLPSAGSIEIDSDLTLCGWNAGDDSEGNGGENRNVSASIQDLSLTRRTVYMQDAEAASGLRIIFENEEDNLLSRFDKFTLNLRGTVLTREDEPVRYELTAVRASNVLSTFEGSISSLPSKRKYISELTDEDLYTFVTLRDCEIPIRKGPFVPIDLRHSSIIHSYPMVLRDIHGDNTHIMTNTTAAWQRDGKGLPQGSGEVSGVIVHETCDNFEWDGQLEMQLRSEGIVTDYITGIGNIGRYQIRPFTRAEIALGDRFEDGFSGLIMEIRYFSSSTANPIVRNASSNGSVAIAYSTWPSVPDPMNDASVKGRLRLIAYGEDDSFSTGELQNMAVYRDWTLLGPLENGVITRPELGNGVTDCYGVQSEWEPYSGASTTALTMKSSAWYSARNWSQSKAWTASFSTEGLTEANLPLSVQLGCVSGLGQTVGAPRYWVVEYSSDGSVWHLAGEYSCPDFPILSNRKPWQCPGYKYVSVTLPDDTSMLGKTEVYVRLRPRSSAAGEASSYDGGSIVSGKETEMNYFAIRYNK